MKAEGKTAKVQAIHSAIANPGLTLDDLQVLKAQFPKDRLGVKVQSFNRERNRAMLVLYLQHTDVQDRLEQVDPAWSMEVLKEDRVEGAVFVRMRLTVKGISRENIGEGHDPKGAYSDALKRCAMLFGVGRYLYDSETVWVEYQESKDKYKQWTIEDYEGHAANLKKEMGKNTRSRDQLYRILMSLYRPYLAKFSDTKFVEFLTARYGVGETRLMTEDQMEDLVAFMEGRLKESA